MFPCSLILWTVSYNTITHLTEYTVHLIPSVKYQPCNHNVLNLISLHSTWIAEQVRDVGSDSEVLNQANYMVCSISLVSDLITLHWDCDPTALYQTDIRAYAKLWRLIFGFFLCSWKIQRINNEIWVVFSGESGPENVQWPFHTCGTKDIEKTLESPDNDLDYLDRLRADFKLAV